MLKKLWLIFGPLLIASLLTLVTIFSFPTKLPHHVAVEKKNAVSLTNTSFKNGVMKEQALTDPNQKFIPFFGSSEWSRMDAMHPSVVAEKYDRHYRPFLLGKRGSQSLSQYFGMQHISKSLKNGNAVFVISPQWFTSQGANTVAVQQYLSNSQLLAFLLQADGKGQEDAFAASRMLALNPGVSYSRYLKKISQGIPLTAYDKFKLRLLSQLTKHEESLFSHFSYGDTKNINKINRHVKSLPNQYSYQELGNIATRRAIKETSNNPFNIKNSFYKKKILKDLPKFKGVQSHYSYLTSPEYNDFEMVLSEFAKQHTNVIFVITPVNDKWAKYTGLNLDNYRKSVAKIRYQLESQGFSHIVDLSNEGGNPYFMQDTIHIGWNGWLAFDKGVYPFLVNKQDTPNYQINNYFYSREWAQEEHLPKK